VVLTSNNLTSDPLLLVENLHVHFPPRRRLFARPRGPVRAVDGVSFAIGRGETLGLVGESGCGKTTTGRAILRLVEPTGGRVRLDGEDMGGLSGEALRARRRLAQIVFQDPFSSLNPRHRVRDILRAPLDIHGVGDRAAREARVIALMEQVGLRADQANDFPHQFSGGQRQRIGIARALALEPKLIVCDEPVSALDVSVQAQIMNLLRRLQRESGLAYLFISHDLRVVRHMSHRIAVMYAGGIVEIGDAASVFDAPLHPYSEALLASAPATHPRLRGRATAIAESNERIAATGCPFSPRCPHAIAQCRVERPALTARDDGRKVACHVR
jgi:peptide/nickel transport system ATP-binding protein